MVVGAYRLIEQIGAGGMGVVWLAQHELLGRRAAVKMLHAKFADDAELERRFFNEARAMTTISDPGIAQVFEFGSHEGRAYIVMELLDGQTLERRLRTRGPMELGDALRFIRQVASSLGIAHARNIVHRDLKPDNIFIVRDPEVPGGERAKILDFGIAKLADNPSGIATSESALLGTPLYMSPEQCRGAGAVDERSDIYSLGCMLYTLIVGRTPFEAAGVGEIIAQHLREPAPSVSTKKPVPPEVDALVARCLAKEPGERFADGAALAREIEEILTRLGPTARNAAATVATMFPERVAVGVDTTLSASAVSIAPTRTSHRGVWMGAAAAVAGVGGLIIWAASRTPETTPVIDAEAVAVAPLRDAAPVAPREDASIASVEARIVATLNGFVRWAQAHPADACPSHGELASVVEGGLDDPWSHPLAITCTAQPAGQMIGVISAGSDGVFGTSDDVRSWNLADDVTRIARGKRWHSAVVGATAAKPALRAPQPAPIDAGTPEPLAPPRPTSVDGIPTHR